MKKLARSRKTECKKAFPLTKSPLVQCITNEITCESMANALLYVDAKPVMADDPREFKEFFAQADGLLLNLGHISKAREANLREASRYAKEVGQSTVVDLVGIAATKLRQELGRYLYENEPDVIKGNVSEMRAFCQLASSGRGVDGSSRDQSEAALKELAAALEEHAAEKEIIFLATGEKDLIVSQDATLLLENGAAELDRFTGTGDIVGSLIAALLGTGLKPLAAVIAAVSYFNICGENAAEKTRGLADFRQETLNQLSLLAVEEPEWFERIEGAEK